MRSKFRPNEHSHFGHPDSCGIWVGSRMDGKCTCGAGDPYHEMTITKPEDSNEVDGGSPASTGGDKS